jgi:hypothetical protein
MIRLQGTFTLLRESGKGSEPGSIGNFTPEKLRNDQEVTRATM